MAKGLYDNGEEAIIRAYFDPSFTPPSTLYVGLFSDSSDTLPDGAVEVDITTEPSDGSYSRAELDLSADFTYSFNAANNFQAVATNVDVVIAGVTTQDVDSWFIADDTRANGGTLLFAGALTETATIPDGDDVLQIGEVGVYLA